METQAWSHFLCCKGGSLTTCVGMIVFSSLVVNIEYVQLPSNVLGVSLYIHILYLRRYVSLLLASRMRRAAVSYCFVEVLRLVCPSTCVVFFGTGENETRRDKTFCLCMDKCTTVVASGPAKKGKIT